MSPVEIGVLAYIVALGFLAFFNSRKVSHQIKKLSTK